MKRRISILIGSALTLALLLASCGPAAPAATPVPAPAPVSPPTQPAVPAPAPTAAPAPAPTPAAAPASATTSAPAPPPTPTPTPPRITTPAPAPPVVAPVPPPAVVYTVMTATKPAVGEYLVDGKGMTLYYLSQDSVGKSTATASVIALWPIFNAGTFSVVSSLAAGDFGSVTRDDGQRQAAYKGWPLYYYSGDRSAGDILGNGIGGIWFVVNPASFPPSKSTPPATSPAGSSGYDYSY